MRILEAGALRARAIPYAARPPKDTESRRPYHTARIAKLQSAAFLPTDYVVDLDGGLGMLGALDALRKLIE